MSIIYLSEKDYSKIAQNTLPVVVEFFASWCPKCAMMESVYHRVALQLKDKVIFYKIDVDHAPDLIASLGIDLYPTFIVYLNGNILGYTSGVLTESTLLARICALISDK